MKRFLILETSEHPLAILIAGRYGTLDEAIPRLRSMQIDNPYRSFALVVVLESDDRPAQPESSAG